MSNRRWNVCSNLAVQHRGCQLLACLLLTLCTPLTGQTVPDSRQRTTQPARTAEAVLAELPAPRVTSDLDRFILNGMRQAGIPGLSAAVVQNQRLVWTGHYGWADIERRIPVSDKTLFQVASVSKTVTACVVMQLVERGQLKLDEDVNQVLPFSVRNPRQSDTPITLRHLLTHTSGIRDHWQLLEKTWVKNGDFPETLGDSLSAYLTPQGEYYHAKKNFFRWAAGTKCEYANVGVALAAYVAEVRSGRPFEELCARGVFEPLGMQASAFRLAAVDRTRLAMPYALKKKKGRFQPLGHHGYLDYPSGTLRTSVPQLARFLMSFIGDGSLNGVRVLQSATVSEMRRVAWPDIAPGQGLVWYRQKMRGVPLLGHDGGDPGVSSLMFYRPSDGTGFVVLMNAEPRREAFEDALAARLLQFADAAAP